MNNYRSEIVELALRLPAADLDALAECAASGRHAVKKHQAAAGFAVKHGCDVVLAGMKASSPAEVSGLLWGAANAAQRVRRRMDVVWTGPTLVGGTVRLTSTAVADLVDEATKHVFLVSYAMHTEPSLSAALHRAVARNVDVVLLCERAVDNPKFHGVSEPFPALEATRLCWPTAQRVPGAALHAKILLVDRAIALVGSANITGSALDRNLECGLLVRDEAVASTIADTLDALLAAKVLKRL